MAEQRLFEWKIFFIEKAQYYNIKTKKVNWCFSIADNLNVVKANTICVFFIFYL